VTFGRSSTASSRRLPSELASMTRMVRAEIDAACSPVLSSGDLIGARVVETEVATDVA
jgi:hypothetical protein